MYEADAVAVLTTQTTGTSTQASDKPPVLTNPLLNFDSSLQTAAVVLIQAVSTPEVLHGIDADGSNGSNVVITDGSTDIRFLSTHGPFIIFNGTSTSAAGVRDVIVRAEQRARQELLDRQKQLGAPQSTYVDLVDVLPVSAPSAQILNKVRTAAIILVLVAGLGLALAYVAQRILDVRRAAKAVASDMRDDNAAADATVAQRSPVATSNPSPGSPRPLAQSPSESAMNGRHPNQRPEELRPEELAGLQSAEPVVRRNPRLPSPQPRPVTLEGVGVQLIDMPTVKVPSVNPNARANGHRGAAPGMAPVPSGELSATDQRRANGPAATHDDLESAQTAAIAQAAPASATAERTPSARPRPQPTPRRPT